MISVIQAALEESQMVLSQLLSDEKALSSIHKAAESLSTSLKAGGRVFTCGNGGSYCDAMHFAEELSGRFRRDRAALAAQVMGDPSHMTCVGNDFGFDYIFSRYLEAHGRQGDQMIAITTSGKSPNILEAAKVAKKIGVTTIALTAHNNPNPLAELADLVISTPKTNYADRVQELHIKVIHILIECIERNLFPENYQEG